MRRIAASAGVAAWLAAWTTWAQDQGDASAVQARLAEARNRATIELFQAGDFAAAEAAAGEAVTANEASLGTGHAQTAAAWFNLALIHQLQGRHEVGGGTARTGARRARSALRCGISAGR